MGQLGPHIGVQWRVHAHECAHSICRRARHTRTGRSAVLCACSYRTPTSAHIAPTNRATCAIGGATRRAHRGSVARARARVRTLDTSTRAPYAQRYFCGTTRVQLPYPHECAHRANEQGHVPHRWGNSARTSGFSGACTRLSAHTRYVDARAIRAEVLLRYYTRAATVPPRVRTSR